MAFYDFCLLSFKVHVKIIAFEKSMQSWECKSLLWFACVHRCVWWWFGKDLTWIRANAFLAMRPVSNAWFLVSDMSEICDYSGVSPSRNAEAEVKWNEILSLLCISSSVWNTQYSRVHFWNVLECHVWKIASQKWQRSQLVWTRVTCFVVVFFFFYTRLASGLDFGQHNMFMYLCILPMWWVFEIKDLAWKPPHPLRAKTQR